MRWDPGFAARSPMLQPLAQYADTLRTCAEWPSLETLQAMIEAAGVENARGIRLQLVAAADARSANYESTVFEHGQMRVRAGEWHDLFNVLAWLAFPRAKAALNARHVHAMKETRAPAPGNRGRAQDALTVFDESGAVFATSDETLIADLRDFRWKDLFWRRRPRTIESARVFVFGHALFEKALDPYIGMTAHALPLLVSEEFLGEPIRRQLELIDERLAETIADPRRLESPRDLAPLPVLGVPGWWPANESESFYDNTAYFRPGRRSRA